MNRQYLESFTEDQLKHYLNTLKRRVIDMKNLTIALGQENLELAEEYKMMTEKKKQAHFAVEKNKNSWSNWLHKSKEKISNMLHLNKEETSEFQPQFAKQQAVQVEEIPHEIVQQRDNERQMGEVRENKDINMGNFNFDDLYYISRDKLKGLMGKGSEQIKHIKEILIDKVKAKDNQADKDESCEKEDEKREGQNHNYAHLAKEEDLSIKNTTKSQKDCPPRKSEETSQREYTPADL